MRYEFAKTAPLTRARRVTLASPLTESAVEAIRERLAAVDGLNWVELTVGTRELRVAYDAGMLGYIQAVEELRQAGAAVSEDRWSRWRGAWYGFVDDNLRGNADASPTCCSRPPPKYRR